MGNPGGGQVLSGVHPKEAIGITLLVKGLTCIVGVIACVVAGVALWSGHWPPPAFSELRERRPLLLSQ